jgi:dolichol kinase
VSCALPVFVTKAAALGIGAGMSVLLLAAARGRTLRGVNLGGGAAGAVLFPAGLALSVLLFWRVDAVIFQWSALLLALADAAAGAGGGLWGKKHFSVTGHKTVEGSLLFFAVALALLGTFVWLRHGGLPGAYGAAVFAGALGVTAVESALGRGWDNVGVPLAAGAVLLMLK